MEIQESCPTKRRWCQRLCMESQCQTLARMQKARSCKDGSEVGGSRFGAKICISAEQCVSRFGCSNHHEELDRWYWFLCSECLVEDEREFMKDSTPPSPFMYLVWFTVWGRLLKHKTEGGAAGGRILARIPPYCRGSASPYQHCASIPMLPRFDPPNRPPPNAFTSTRDNIGIRIFLRLHVPAWRLFVSSGYP